MKTVENKALMRIYRKHLTLPSLLSDFLTEIINEEERYELSKRKAINILNKGYHLGGKTLCSREDLHER